MVLLKLPLTRWTIFCVIILALLFSNYLGVFTFFVLSAGFSVLESYLTKKNFDKKTGNKIIDYGWIGFLLITLTIVLIFVFK
ncbi:hypothetical protein [Bacillus sp. B15-48]|uniref:hypothetical protein n=1 Tax=Bacillus sp. B15-48 TaxID=1548601 RepID=UPI00193FFFA7|nr:hypothetical protein [Bacillus sp. B15-48]MBM4763728.1 hypothetical protein [Bacillus sp. B15-48]